MGQRHTRLERKRQKQRRIRLKNAPRKAKERVRRTKRVAARAAKKG